MNFQNFVWVFRPDQIKDLKRKIDLLIDAGYAFATKTHDGDGADDGDYFKDNFWMMDNLIDNRVPHYAWGYNYGDTYGKLDAEISTAVSWVHCADGYIFDPEIEFEVAGSGAWVEKMVQAVLDASGEKPVGYAPFWNRRWHQAYPYASFDKFGLRIQAMPQVYYDLAERTTEEKRTEMFDISKADFPGNFMPVAGTQDVAGLMHFLKKCDEVDVGHSIWCLDTMTDYQLEYLDLLAKVRNLDGAYGEYKRVFDAIQTLKQVLR